MRKSYRYRLQRAAKNWEENLTARKTRKPDGRKKSGTIDDRVGVSYNEGRSRWRA